MKLFRNLIIMVVILAVAAGTFFFVSKYKENESEETSAEWTDLYVNDEENIQRFEITNNGIKYVFAKDTDGQWGILKPQLKLSESNMQSLLSEIASIRVKETVSDASTDLKQYGLDKGITISIHVKGKPKKTYVLGDILFNSNGYYIMDKDEPGVYVISSTKGSVLATNFSTIVDTELINLGENGMNRVSIRKDGKFVYDLYAKETGRWRIVSPIEADVKTTLIEDIVQYSKISASSYVDYAKDVSVLKKYGLINPSYTVTLGSSSSSKITFDLGNEDSQGNYYGKVQGEKFIFLIDPTTIPFIDLTIKDIILQFVDFQMIDDMSELSIQVVGNKKDTFSISHEVEGDVTNHFYEYNGFDVTNMRDKNANLFFSAVYTGFVSIPWVDVDYTSKPVLKKPYITISYKKTDGTSNTISYQKKNTQAYYAFKNGKFTNLLVSKQDITLAIKARERFIKEYKRKSK